MSWPEFHIYLDDDGEDVVEERDFMGWLTAYWLFHCGRLSQPTEDERGPQTMFEWARPRLSADEWRRAVARVKRMSPEERGDYMRPLIGDYDA